MLEIYNTVPQEVVLPLKESKRYDILKFLRANREVFFRSKQIAKECGFPIKGTCVEVRKAITELIELDYQPIISTSKGYCYTRNYQRVVCYLDSLNNRKQGLHRRIKAISHIASNMWTGGLKNG